jgi:hypothetical protein
MRRFAPEFTRWIPAFTGMTMAMEAFGFPVQTRRIVPDGMI